MHFYEAKCINYLFVGVFFEPDIFFRVQNVFNNFLYMIDA